MSFFCYLQYQFETFILFSVLYPGLSSSTYYCHGLSFKHENIPFIILIIK
jgi:hypothetical protein